MTKLEIYGAPNPSDHIATITHVMRREKHIWNASVLQTMYISNFVRMLDILLSL
jgi:hypothetical protein